MHNMPLTPGRHIFPLITQIPVEQLEDDEHGATS